MHLHASNLALYICVPILDENQYTTNQYSLADIPRLDVTVTLTALLNKGQEIENNQKKHCTCHNKEDYNMCMTI